MATIRRGAEALERVVVEAIGIGGGAIEEGAEPAVVGLEDRVDGSAHAGPCARGCNIRRASSWPSIWMQARRSASSARSSVMSLR